MHTLYVLDYFANSPFEIEFPIISWGQLRVSGLASLSVAGRLESAFTVTYVSTDVSNWPTSFLFTVGMLACQVPRHLTVCCCSVIQTTADTQHSCKMNWARWTPDRS